MEAKRDWKADVREAVADGDFQLACEVLADKLLEVSIIILGDEEVPTVAKLQLMKLYAKLFAVEMLIGYRDAYPWVLLAEAPLDLSECKYEELLIELDLEVSYLLLLATQWYWGYI